jgi:hypothetical protein
MRGLAARAGVRALGRGARCAAFRSFLHAGTVFGAGTAEPDRGSDEVAKSWAEIVEGRTIALRWRPGIVQIGGEPAIALSRGPYILQRMQAGAPIYRVGLYQTVWVRDGRDGVWRVLYDGSASPARRWTTARRPIAGSRNRRCRTARRSGALRGSGADHAALEEAALGAAEAE